MKKNLLLILFTLASSTNLFANNTSVVIHSNSILNEFQCDNQEWQKLGGSLLMRFPSSCTPLKGKNRDGNIYTLDTTASCSEGLVAAYNFHGWEGNWEFIQCMKPN